VVNNILDFSKLGEGKVAFETIDFSINESLNSVVALLGPKARGEGLELTTSIAEGMPGYLTPTRIGQILLNLVGNAIKFTKIGSVTVAASHHALQDDAIELRIEVSDTGAGIPEDVQKLLFNPFTRPTLPCRANMAAAGLALQYANSFVWPWTATSGLRANPDMEADFGSPCSAVSEGRRRWPRHWRPRRRLTPGHSISWWPRTMASFKP
jgi:K+-sensing histidine kinase KdpD